MKKTNYQTKLLAALLTLGLGLSSAYAQPQGGGQGGPGSGPQGGGAGHTQSAGQGGNHGGQQGGGPGGNGHGQSTKGQGGQGPNSSVNNGPHPGAQGGHAQRGGGSNPHFQKGDHMPASYRMQRYVVDDWRGHNLSAPPRGHEWVQVGSEFALIAITTGVIVQILQGR